MKTEQPKATSCPLQMMIVIYQRKYEVGLPPYFSFNNAVNLFTVLGAIETIQSFCLLVLMETMIFHNTV